jgi:hypothetical protein
VASQLNPLLLELFESVYRDLAQALERRQHLSNVCGDQEVANAAEQRQRIAKLEIVMNGLEGALDLRESGIVH